MGNPVQATLEACQDENYYAKGTTRSHQASRLKSLQTNKPIPGLWESETTKPASQVGY